MRHFCQGSHMLCQWHNVVNEVGVGMSNDAFAFFRPVAKEVYGSFFQEFEITFFGNDFRLHPTVVDGNGLVTTLRTEGTVVDTGIDFHTSGIEHRTQQGVFLDFLMIEQHRGSQELEGGHLD